jgi:hypothetical protein
MPCDADLQEMSSPLANSQRRFVAVISAIALALFTVVWLVRSQVEVLSEQKWLAPLALVLLFFSSVILYLRSRTLSLMRPWLVRHLVGNLILAIGVVLVWSFDFPPFYYLVLGSCIFFMWIWATRKLREAIQKSG